MTTRGTDAAPAALRCRWIWLVAGLAFSVGFLLQNPALVLPDEFTRFPDQKWNFARPIGSWLHHSYFTEGFGRRLLFGSLLYPVPPDLRLAVYSATSLLVLAGFAATLAALVRQTGSARKDACLVLGVAALSSAGAMNLGWLFGYFETYLHLIFALSVLLALRGRLLAVTALTGVALLIHVAYLFYAFPVVLGVLIARGQGGARDWRLGLLLSGVVALVAALFVFGNSEVEAMGANRGLVEILAYQPETYATAAGYLVLMAALQWRVFARLSLPKGLLFFGPYATLILFVMGVDQMRWVTMFFVAVILSILGAAALAGEDRKRRPLGPVDVLLMVLLAMPIAGPIGNTRAFEALRQFLSFIG